MEWEPLSLLLWLGLCISGLEPQEYNAVETRKEGQTLSVQCPYNQEQYREQLKGWRQLRGRTYYLLVRTQYTTQGHYQKKVTVKTTTIQDDTDKGVVNITMKMLRMQDTGVYSCTLFFHNAWYPLKTIQLTVSKRLTTENILTTLYTASALNFSTLDARYNGEPQSNCQVSFGVSSLLLSFFPIQLMACPPAWVPDQQDPDGRDNSSSREKTTAQRGGTRTRLQAQEYDAVESREEGETLSVQCPYDQQQYREALKAWYQLRGGTYYHLVSTQYTSLGGYQREASLERTMIQDDNSKGTVTITIKRLQLQDAGVYMCGCFGHNHTVHILKIIKLKVSQRVQEHKAVEGQNVSVQCLYSMQNYSRERKAWCRYTGKNKCDVLVSTYFSYGRYQNQGQVERTTIHDNTQNGTVTITVEKLQADDSGVYWCALYDPPHLYRLFEVQLAVSKGLTTENIPTTPYTGPALKSSTPDSRNNREPQKNSEVSFGISSWPVLLLGLLTTKTLMAVTIALLVRRRLRRGEELRVASSMRQWHKENQNSNPLSILRCRDEALLCLKAGMEWRPAAVVLLLWLGLCIPGLEPQEYDAVETRKEGQTLSVQCPYNQQQYRKLLKGWYQLRGRIHYLLVRTQYTTQGDYQKVTVGRTTIQDDTDKGVVNITMKMLQMQDAGMYTCTLFFPNEVYPLKTIRLWVYQRVQEHKAVEGQNLTVRCPYSARDYSGNGKAWCRYTDKGKCDVLVSTYASRVSYRYQGQAKRTTILDNTQDGTVAITMEKLQADDSGVYWCALYDPPHLYPLVEVQLAVSKAPATSTSHTTPIITTSPGASTPSSRLPLGDTPFVIFGVVLGVLLALALISSIILYIRQRKKRGKGGEQAEGIYDKPGNPTVLQDVGKTEDPKDDKEGTSQDLKYAILNFKSQTSPNESIYANVEPSQAPITHNNFPTEPVEYAIIALKPLPSASKE
ncbi:uncharacterized protein LOC102380646 [Alligator sinensis]|uniref:Uncharacterized protein LOC102380646 n=1 Tax=Alligator sinensis TaxID=38654 RepID=A0A3Q0GPB5_ALLSI|nr:uncharacterized protein LOC102380646 [Alligator sinensis]